jgi:predicted nucleic acid-binding protein
VIFLDANYFLRYLTHPTIPATEAMHATATALFRAVARGEEEVTTSEAVLAEVALVLSSKHQDNLPSAAVAAYLAPILRLANLRLPRGQRWLWLRGLDFWAATPQLGFVDALTAAYAERPATALASFDTDFDRILGITRWQPPVPDHAQ